jgi:Cofactor assembly of complex C subunit B, CCB2/CCB4
MNNQWIKNFPLIVGIVGGFLLMTNRLVTPTVLDSQARSDALGIFLCAMLLLISILLGQINPNPPESVDLIGKEGIEIDKELPNNIQTEIAWASHLILSNTVTKTIVIYYQGKTLLRRGILGGNNDQVTEGSIIERVMKIQKPVYLVDLKHYPGKIEFDYLPENIQGLICLPLNQQGVMIVATNIPRSYSKKDEIWIQGISEKIALTLTIDS